MKKALIILAAALLALPMFSANSKQVLQAFQNPQDAYRPYVRWWWNGDCVTEPEIRREMNLLTRQRHSPHRPQPATPPQRP